MPMTALLLAGDRGGADPLLQASGAPCKALLPVAGRAMVLRVLDALLLSQEVGDILLCGPARQLVRSSPGLEALIDKGRVRWMAAGKSPCASVTAAFKQIPPQRRVLLTTADHALLQPSVVDTFCIAARDTKSDLLVAAARANSVARAFPGVRRTAYRLRDEAWCGCNLFAFLTPRARQAASWWRRVEANRKHPWKIAGLVGWSFLLRYLMRRMTLLEATRRIGQRMGIEIAATILDEPETAIDVDTIADWDLVKAHLEQASAAHHG